MAEMETDSTERPVIPPRILRTEVILNPFTDIVVREGRMKRTGPNGREQSESEDQPAKRGPKYEMCARDARVTPLIGWCWTCQ